MWSKSFGLLPVELVQEMSDFLPYIDIIRMEMSTRTMRHLVESALLHYHFAQRLVTAISQQPSQHALEIMLQQTQLPIYRKIRQIFEIRWHAGPNELLMCPQLHVMAYSIFSKQLRMSFCPLPWPKFEFHQWILSRICDKGYHHQLLYMNELPNVSPDSAGEHWENVRLFYKTMPGLILGRLTDSYLSEETKFLESEPAQNSTVFKQTKNRGPRKHVQSNYSKCDMCCIHAPEMEMKYEHLCLFCASNPRLHHHYLAKRQFTRKRKRKTYADSLHNDNRMTDIQIF